MEEFGNGEIGGIKRLGEMERFGGNGEIWEDCKEIAEVATEWLWLIWVTGKGHSESEVHWEMGKLGEKIVGNKVIGLIESEDCGKLSDLGE